MAVKKNKKFSGASHAGFHFLNLYQCCPRKFYLKWIVGLNEMYVARPLIYGAAFHEAKAEWYRTGDKQKAIDKGVNEIESNELLFEKADDYTDCLMRIIPMLKNWINTYGIDDLRHYDVIAVEEEIQMHENGYEFTGRPDTLLRKKSNGLLYCMETKTSGFNAELTIAGVTLGDQATSYYMLVKHKYNEMLAGVIPDIAYHGKGSNASPNSSRGMPVIRTQADIDRFKLSVFQLAAEISSKANAVINLSMEPMQVFPRNSYYCNSYGKPCEFANICRQELTIQSRVPHGFKKNKDINYKISDYVADIIGT